LLPYGFRSAFRQEFRSPKTPVLERLGIEPTLWSAVVRDFGRALMNVAGTAKSVSQARKRNQAIAKFGMWWTLIVKAELSQSLSQLADTLNADSGQKLSDLRERRRQLRMLRFKSID